MECVTCLKEAGFNRAVVDLLSGIELGGFCLNCEEEEFGRSLKRSFWGRADGCALCERDAHFALALWEPHVRDEGDEIVCFVDYEVTESTVCLCDEHLHQLRESVEPVDHSAVWDTA